MTYLLTKNILSSSHAIKNAYNPGPEMSHFNPNTQHQPRHKDSSNTTKRLASQKKVFNSVFENEMCTIRKALCQGVSEMFMTFVPAWSQQSSANMEKLIFHSILLFLPIPSYIQCWFWFLALLLEPTISTLTWRGEGRGDF